MGVWQDERNVLWAYFLRPKPAGVVYPLYWLMLGYHWEILLASFWGG